MAKGNPGDILDCDWNPVIGCERYSKGCVNCWFMDSIFPWQKRLGNIPEDILPTNHYAFPKRLTIESLKVKNGVVGIVQHGDLFWDKVPTAIIEQVLDIINKTAIVKRTVPKYVLWTKRAERMHAILEIIYPLGLPKYLSCAVSIEDQTTADARLPFLNKINGTRIVVAEPILGPIDISKYVPDVDWVIVGSETGDNARPISLDWIKHIRDQTKALGKPFFIKQLGSSHHVQIRIIDGKTWDERPIGFKIKSQ